MANPSFMSSVCNEYKIASDQVLLTLSPCPFTAPPLLHGRTIKAMPESEVAAVKRPCKAQSDIASTTIGSEVRVQMEVTKDINTMRLPRYRNSGDSYDSRWPEEAVTCGLKVEVWRDLAKLYDLGDEAVEVIKGLEKGFHQGIPDHTLGIRKWFTPENHQSAYAAAEKIHNTLAREFKERRIYGPFNHDEVFQQLGFFRSSPMGSVVNGDGSFRVINDMSYPQNNEEIPSVNSFVDKTEFDTSWDDFVILARFFSETKGDFLLAIFDWEKAYRQIPVCPSQWRYLLILDLQGRLWLDTRVQFGGVAGCGVFGRPADLWRKIVKRRFRLAGAFRWVDDNLLVKERRNTTTIQDVVDLSNKMGVASSRDKVFEFDIEQKYIGFIWNASERTVRLPDDKLRERTEQVTYFLTPRTVFSYKEVEKLIGRLVHTTYIVPNLKCYLSSLYRWKKEWHVKSATRPIPADVRADLLEWEKSLKSFETRRFIPDVETTDVGWVGDAASSFGIGVLVKDRWAQFRLKKGWKQHLKLSEKGGIAWAETAAIRLGLIMISKLFNTKGKKFKVLKDNTTSECVVSKHRSRDRAVNEEWKVIQTLLVEFQCDIVAERVKSAENAADWLSRNVGEVLPPNKVVKVEIPEDLLPVLEQTFQDSRNN